jgi:tetratricopeptide (TPR) repeat protein
MPANVEGMVREGINAYRAGKKEEARALLLRAVEIDQYNEQAWLWLSAVVDSPEEQRTCLENVLTINPNNERARQGLELLSKEPSAAPPAADPSPSDEDVLASSMIAQTDEELPSSIDWGAPAAPVTATSSSSSYHHVDEPSAQEYDSWVANLGLGANNDVSGAPSAATPPPTFSAAFLEDDEDLFGLDSASVFVGDSEPPAKAVTPPPKTTSKPAASSVMSPDPKPASPAKASDHERLLDEIDDDADLIADLDEDYDDARLDKLDPEEMFRYIPKEIKATRLPGTRERYPVLAVLGLVVAVLLNIGAIAFLVMQLGAPAG